MFFSINSLKKSDRLLVGVMLLIFICILFFQPFLRATSASININNSLVSLDQFNTGAGNNGSSSEHFSDDGNMVLFRSYADNLVPNDTFNTAQDWFVRDLKNGATKIISRTASNQPFNIGSGAISESGKFVAFTSSQTAIDGIGANGASQVYLLNTTTNATEVVSTGLSGELGNANSNTVYTVSNDGRFVLFRSQATNLVSGVSPWLDQLFVKDRLKNTIKLVTKSESGVMANSGFDSASMSCDGSFVVFGTSASSLYPTSYNKGVFIADLRDGHHLSLITQTANSRSDDPTISCDGKYVTFTSNATNLDSEVSVSGGPHIYAYNRLDESIRLVDQSNIGVVGNKTTNNNNQTGDRIVSNTGKVIFSTTATNLVSPSTPNNRFNTYVRDLNSGITHLVSVNNSGQLSNSGSNIGRISRSGEEVIYTTNATNLVPEVTSGIISHVILTKIQY